MKPRHIPKIFLHVILAPALLLPTTALAFECSPKLDGCGNELKKVICDKFELAHRVSKKKCEKVKEYFKDNCPNAMCRQGMEETFHSCYKSVF